ncbi:tRNA preQ1(34) S-adenosylmethionine ribosyltransferase-isomerase QueA [uncultured Fretibacterium sp.]|uniref:tRNA preQ1(34) S-adenosylmethionine ribosyltransferase-isomerase QueA n=1 Tax=uncultured Fretibacterium sp. TaxID=1678694 RepID=UPI0026056619|nr:tRNA preQ1(34) S-adenosylmethionine ribosyltransferase-isomerase QueA [uncultured Fretibacterium sp.]
MTTMAPLLPLPGTASTDRMPPLSHDALFSLETYDYPLSEDRIAQTPAEPRDSSRLLIWDVGSDGVRHCHFRDILDFLRPEDLLVLNDTRVLPARLLGRRVPGGGAAEVLLLSPASQDLCCWRALVRPGRRLRVGAEVEVGDRALRIEACEDDGVRLVRVGEGRRDVLSFLDAFGHVPLPPYIHSEGDWREAYQTVFAQRDGSVAAPTASLHFTPGLLDAIDAMGVHRAWVTLHVGLGTFRPVKAEDIREHVIHEEPCEVPEETVWAVRECRRRGGRVIASGTTVVRTLESMTAGGGEVRSGLMDTGLYIYPGFEFQVVDAMITNFHLPKSSLLMLVAAFAANLGGFKGREERAVARLLSVYKAAMEAGYRFFSFGDAMFIQR